MRSRAAVPIAAIAAFLVLLGDFTALLVRQMTRTQAAPVPAAPSPLDAVLPELVAFVEQARGLRFIRPPDVQLLHDAEFDARLLDDGGEDESTTAAEEEAYLGFLRALGLVEGNVDLDEVARNQLRHIVGFYDTEDKALFARGSEASPYVKYVLVHELTHALDDQHFNLDRRDLADDAAAAFEALVEGSAVVVEQQYLDSLPAEEQAAIAAAEEGDGLEDEGPDVFTRLLSFPYSVGPRFVQEVLEAGDMPRLDATFSDPPVSSEQVLHPERFLAREGPRPVAEPRADGEEVERGTLGELGLILVLDGQLEHSRALRAAAGWGGDRYVAWTSGQQTCVRWSIVMDTPRDTNEVASALRSWAGENRGSTVQGSGPVTFTSCG